MNQFEEELLTQCFELLMPRSDAQGKIDAMTEDAKIQLLGGVKELVRSNLNV